MFEKLCALLLRLYPAEFRRAYGREAVQLMRDRARHERGVFLRVRLVMDLAIDVFATSLHRWQTDQPLLGRIDASPRFDIIEVHGPRPEALAAGMLTSMLMFASFTSRGLAAPQSMPTFPEWWNWDLSFTGHSELRMEQRGVTEVEVHAMLERAIGAWRAAARRAGIQARSGRIGGRRSARARAYIP